MKLSTITVMLLMMMGVISGMLVFTNELASPTAFNVNVNDSVFEGFDRIEELNTNLNSTYTKVRNLQANTGGLVQIITLIPDVLIIVKDAIILPFDMSISFVTELFIGLGMPLWLFHLLIGVVIMSLIYAFIALVVGREP